MQALTIWASPSEHSCVIAQLNLELYSSRSSVKWGERRRSLGLCRTSCHGLLYLSSYFRGFKSRAVVIDKNCELQGNLFCWHRPKRGPFAPAFALAWVLEEEPSVGNNVANEEMGSLNYSSDNSDGVQVTHAQLDNDNNNPEVNDPEKSGKDDLNKTENGNGERVDVRALAYRLHLAKTADDVEKVLKGKEKLPLQVFSTIIRCFGKEKRLDSAVALFKWLKRKNKETDNPIKLNLFIYNNLLGALKHANFFDVIEEIINDMAMEGVSPNVVTYNTLMGIYIGQGQELKAIQILEEMPAKVISPSPVSYSTVIYAYLRMEDGFGALSFFVEIRNKYEKGEIGKESDIEDWCHEFEKLENFVTCVCYQVMRRWLARSDNRSTHVLRLLKEMDKVGLNPSRDENERLVWACTREKHHLVAKELYNRIRETYTEVSLSVCNHVIWLLGKAKKWWTALEIYEDLLDKGPKPNNMSYNLIVSHFNILLKAARRKGVWRWGVRLLNKMEEKGLKPGSREWNSVLVACSKASETEAAIQIFKRMVEQGEKPTIISYGALLSALEKGNLFEEAISVWKHMVKVGVESNLYAYTIMASVYAGQGKFDIVDSIMREMVTTGVDPTVVTYNAIISSCGRNNMGSVAYEWFHRMELENVTPNEVTYEMLIEGVTSDGKPMIAYELYLRARSEGFRLSAKAYDAVVRSSLLYGATIDVSNLGPRPRERKKKVQVKARKNMRDFCKLADVPRRSKPFEKSELCMSQSEDTVI